MWHVNLVALSLEAMLVVSICDPDYQTSSAADCILMEVEIAYSWS